MNKRTNEYIEYQNLLQELNIAEENQKNLENNLFIIKGTISNLKDKLNSISKFTSDEVDMLNDEIKLSKFFDIEYSEGGRMFDYTNTFEYSDEYQEMDAFQKNNYSILEPYLNVAQFEIDNCVTENTLNEENYQIDECKTLQKFINKVIKFHPDYEEFTQEQRKKLKEIIHIFAKHILKH